MPAAVAYMEIDVAAKEDDEAIWVVDGWILHFLNIVPI